MQLSMEQEKRLARYSAEFLTAARYHVAQYRKLPAIENPELTFPESGFGQVAAGFDFDGARYHVWLDNKPENVRLWEHGARMYKNPPLGVKHNSPEDFRTRQLDTTAGRNVLLLTALFLVLDFDMERMKAQAAVKARAEIARAEAISRTRAAVVRNNAEVLFLALRNITDYPTDAGYRADAIELLTTIEHVQAIETAAL